VAKPAAYVQSASRGKARGPAPSGRMPRRAVAGSRRTPGPEPGAACGLESTTGRPPRIDRDARRSLGMPRSRLSGRPSWRRAHPRAPRRRPVTRSGPRLRAHRGTRHEHRRPGRSLSGDPSCRRTLPKALRGAPVVVSNRSIDASRGIRRRAAAGKRRTRAVRGARTRGRGRGGREERDKRPAVARARTHPGLRSPATPASRRVDAGFAEAGPRPGRR
jgi:hypothetical protein